MIDPKELRIGNFIFDNDDRTTIITAIFEDGDYFDSISQITRTELSLQDARPIALSPAILHKFGFNMLKGRNGNEFYSIHTGYIEFQWECFGEGVLIALDMETINLGNCMYLHQLQNLYFALTGKELTIKP
jgi:hypothetical protein